MSKLAGGRQGKEEDSHPRTGPSGWALPTKGLVVACELPATVFLLLMSIRGNTLYTGADLTLHLVCADGLMWLGPAKNRPQTVPRRNFRNQRLSFFCDPFEFVRGKTATVVLVYFAATCYFLHAGTSVLRSLTDKRSRIMPPYMLASSRQPRVSSFCQIHIIVLKGLRSRRNRRRQRRTWRGSDQRGGGGMAGGEKSMRRSCRGACFDNFATSVPNYPRFLFKCFKIHPHSLYYV